MAINYTKKTWQNAPSTATPLSAANVQIMDNAIEAACDGVDTLNDNLALKINNTTGLPQVTNGSFFVSGVDADTLKHTGAYYCSGASAELHYPSGAGFMRVMAAYDNVTYQQYYPAASDTYYVRRYVSSAWTAWVAK